MPTKGNPCDGEPAKRIQEATERVAFRLDRPHAHVGADLREKHVAGDEDAQSRAMERSVFGRMTVPGYDAPAVRPDRDLIAGDQALVRKGELGDATAVSVTARGQRREVLGREPMGPEQIADRVRPVARPLVGNGVRGQVFGLRHRHRAVPALGEPRSVPEVVRVVMRGDHATDRLALERAGKMVLP